MAASSKPTGVHYALVVFVLISIICGLGWLLAYKGSNSIGDMRRELDAAKNKEADATKLANSLLDDLKKLRDATGLKYEDVGDGTNPATMLGAINMLIKNYSKGAADPTWSGMTVKQDQFLMSVVGE